MPRGPAAAVRGWWHTCPDTRGSWHTHPMGDPRSGPGNGSLLGRAITVSRPPGLGEQTRLVMMNDHWGRGGWRACGAGVVGRFGHIEVAVAVEHAVSAGPLPQQVAGGRLAGEPLRAGVGAGESGREVHLGLLVGERPLGGVGELGVAEDPGP